MATSARGQGGDHDRGGRPRGPPLEPEQGLLPRARAHQARPGRVLPRRRRRRLPAPARAPDDDEALRRRGRRRVLLPEAGAEDGAGLDRDGDGEVPQRAQRDRALRQRRRAPDLGREPRGDRLQPVAGAARRPRPSGRAARRPRPDPGVELRRGAPGGDVRARGARRPRAARLPEDLRLARHPRQRPDRAALDVHRGAPRRAGPGARGRARARSSRPRSGGRRSATASSSTTTRTPATAPSPRPGRCARRPTRASRPRSSGTRCPTSTRPSSAWTRCRRGSPSAATRRPTIDDVHHSLDSLHELADRDEAEGLGDAPWPPHFRKQTGEGKRVQPSRAKKD